MDFKTAQSRAAMLCSQQERCTSYIKDKLKQWDQSEADSEKILIFLRKEKFLDDSRFALFFVKDKFRLNQWGKIKIRYALRQKQIPAEAIEAAIKQISDEDYLQTCVHLLEGKLRSIKDTNHLSRKAKLLRFAAQRGFESDTIFHAIDLLNDNSTPET